jgi:plasmid stability protein
MALIQIRHVPDEVHRTLRVRAAMEGTSLSDYVLREITRAAQTPTPAELDERIRARPRANVSTADVLAARDAGRRE